MKFRQHCGGLEESMATCVEIPATLEALRRHLNKIYTYSAFLTSELLQQPLTFSENDGPDDRVGWKANYTVMLGGKGVGSCDELPEDKSPLSRVALPRVP